MVSTPDLVAGLPPLLHAPIFVALLLWLATALGWRILRAFGLATSALRVPERGLLCATLGLGALQLLPYGLSLGRLMTPAGVRLAMAGLALLLWRDLLAVARSAWRYARGLRLPRTKPLLWAWLGLFGSLLALLFLHALRLSAFGDDDDGYHLSAPARWLAEQTLSYLPSYTHTNAGLGFEMSYVIALAFAEPIGAKLLHYASGLLMFGAVLACARRLGSKVAGLAVVSWLMVPTPLLRVPLLFQRLFVDFPTNLALLLTVLTWLVWRRTRDRRLLWCMALCAGLTGSFKFTALASCGVWFAIVALELFVQGLRLREALPLLGRFGALTALPVLPWLARNWQVTGNPLYPMLSSWLPTRDWTAEQAGVFGRYIRYYSWGIASGENMSLAARQLLLVVAAALVLAATWLGFRWLRSLELRLLLVVAAASLLSCIGLTGLFPRYWLPGLTCGALVACIAFAQWLRARLPGRESYQLALPLLGAALALGAQARTELQDGELASSLRLALGLTSSASEDRDKPAARMWSYIRDSTGPDARILVGAFYATFGASSYGCFPLHRRCFTTDSHLQTYIDLRSWDGFVQSVERAGIQYVVLSDRLFSPNRQGFRYRAGEHEYPFCRRLVAERGEELFQAEHLHFYRLQLGSGGAARIGLAGGSP